MLLSSVAFHVNPIEAEIACDKPFVLLWESKADAAFVILLFDFICKFLIISSISLDHFEDLDGEFFVIKDDLHFFGLLLTFFQLLLQVFNSLLYKEFLLVLIEGPIHLHCGYLIYLHIISI